MARCSTRNVRPRLPRSLCWLLTLSQTQAGARTKPTTRRTSTAPVSLPTSLTTSSQSISAMNGLAFPRRLTQTCVPSRPPRASLTTSSGPLRRSPDRLGRLPLVHPPQLHALHQHDRRMLLHHRRHEPLGLAHANGRRRLAPPRSSHLAVLVQHLRPLRAPLSPFARSASETCDEESGFVGEVEGGEGE